MSRELPFEFREAAGRLHDDLRRVLGGDLVGVYVYGSALDPSYVPGRSDFDCIVVTSGSIGAPQFAAVEAGLEAAASELPEFDRIQVSFLVRDRVLEDDPSACLYQFGRFSRSGSDGNPIIWLDFLRCGAVLHGPHPNQFLPHIGSDLLHEALVREVGYLREEISDKPNSESRDHNPYRAYAVLTLCRILYSASTGQICSKTEAAEWAIHHLPGEPELHRLIRLAEGVRRERFVATVPLPSIRRFIEHVSRQVGSGEEAT